MSDTDFRVVPGALHKMTGALSGAARAWHDITMVIQSLSMQSLDLGLLGEATDYPDRYNELKNLVGDQLEDGVTVWRDMANALGEVAQTYADKDAEWYEQFNYIDASRD